MENTLMNESEFQSQSKQTIRIFAWSSFLNDLGSDIIYPIWPLFVTSVLGANMAVLGFIDGLGDAMVSLSKAASGYISDRIRRRKVFVWSGYLMGALSRVGYAVSSLWPHLIPFRILDRAGKIRSAPRDAIIADLSTQKNRGKHFGLLRMMDNLGAVCGILICILLYKILTIKILFLLAAIPSVIGAVLILSMIKEKKMPDTRIYKGLAFKDLNKDFILFLVLNAIFALGSFSYSFLLIFAKEHGQENFIPVMYLVFTLTAALFSMPFGRLADRIGRKPVMFTAFFFWGLICLFVIFFKKMFPVFMIFIFQGMHKAALEPAQKTLVSELAPVQFRASSLGGFQMVVGLCAFPASLLAGFLWDKISIQAPFLVSLVFTIAAVILLFFVHEKMPDRASS